jgi:tetratricopeptide (TPR) repeat protein
VTDAGSKDDTAPARQIGPLAWVLAVLTLVVACWVIWQGLRLMRADFASVAARQEIRSWVARTTAPATPADWERAREAIDRAIDIVPDDAAFHDARGDAFVVAATQPSTEEAQRQAKFAEAIASYRRALALRPSEPQTWASLALAHYGAGQVDKPLQEAWSRAQTLGPHEGHVQPLLMELALATWTVATPEMQQWVQDTFEKATPVSREQINKMAERRGLELSIAESAPAAASAPSN